MAHIVFHIGERRQEGMVRTEKGLGLLREVNAGWLMRSYNSYKETMKTLMARE